MEQKTRVNFQQTLHTYTATNLVSNNFLCQPPGHHFCQNLLFALCLSCQLGTPVTKPGNVVLDNTNIINFAKFNNVEMSLKIGKNGQWRISASIFSNMLNLTPV